ncbi:IclR family transcriptional regulator [Komagataeibacter swingsii]|uniref:HTH iclR-type domain-containing protein n=1 Tax=Komagataeibacter swingsii TaxID=215220 RepID=A0A2V4S1T9_9PROT|nr:helix-turn-helix domain-containing protein [Komagataeibacter swingsii]PYD69079.1 hypothetical protein CFR76_11855 [Komagataeibacter swingsii]GBQ65883.1 IclR family transcriptional regulator [Komagataeibacter swingsii DSM 16373]
MDKDKNVSGTIQKAFVLLQIVEDAGTTGLALADIVKRSGLTKTTSHRLLASLQRGKLIEQVPQTRRYRRAGTNRDLSHATHYATVHTREWKRMISSLAVEPGDAFFLFCRNGFDAICIDACFGSGQTPSLSRGVGGRVPLGAGSASLMLLSECLESELEQVLTHNTPYLRDRYAYSPCETIARLERARQDGFDQEQGLFIPNIGGMSVPVPVSPGSNPLALGVSFHLSEHTPASCTRLMRQLSNAALRFHELHSMKQTA